MDQCGGNDRRQRWLAIRAQYRLNVQIALQLICIHFYVDSKIRDYKEIWATYQEVTYEADCDVMGFSINEN